MISAHLQCDSDHVLDDNHYIGRIVKTLNRLFNLVGVDVQEWWNATPRRFAVGKTHNAQSNTRLRVDQHFNTAACAVCSAKKSNGRSAPKVKLARRLTPTPQTVCFAQTASQTLRELISQLTTDC